MVGDESLNWQPLGRDFITVGQKLERLGFTYHKGKVTVIDPAKAL